MARVYCPHCGRLVDKLIEGMCEDCYIEKYPLITVKDKTLLKCKYCGAVYLRGKWVRARKTGTEELVKRILAEKATVRGIVEKIDVQEIGNKLHLHVTVKGSPHPLIAERALAYQIEFSYDNDICIDCREMLSKREIALLQVRGTPRGLDDAMKKKIFQIVEQELYKLKDKRIGYISDIKNTENGVDIYTTSAGLARHLAYVIHKHFPSQIVETAKNIGVKDGRRLYHMTYAVIIITYKPGDIIVLKGERKSTISINNKFIVLYSIETKKYEQITIRELLSSKPLLIGNS
ncbi:MAG: NMD3-related protein [Pyrobaculum sp.]|uniref:60S ribosomal export protein NMD3 n=1 Tax=Pyrobaculum sp. TaxID=2004705 RepID=UPI0031619CBC